MDRTTELAIEKYAAEHTTFDAALIKAVAWVESAGVLFWTINGKNFPAIRFEGHHFYKMLKGAKLQAAVKAGLAAPSMGTVKNPNGWAARYAMFQRACDIDKEAAIAATSWGIGQVMGFNYKLYGYTRPSQVMEKAMEGLEGQLHLMVGHILANNLDGYLKAKDWPRFARGYNGKAYKKYQYDTKLAAAYKRFAKYAKDGHLFLIQERLLELGLYKGKIDGLIGPLTTNAVKAFQQAAGLAVDGKYSTITNEQLDAFVQAKRAQTKKDITPIIAGAGSIVAVSVPQIIEVIEQSRGIVDQAQGLMTALNFAPWVIGIVLAIATGYTIYSLLQKAKTNPDRIEALHVAQHLAAVRNEGAVSVVDYEPDNSEN